jgi:hypothetical protein
MLLLVLSCSKTPRPAATHEGEDDDISARQNSADLCRTPNTDCPCEEPGQVVNCGEVVARSPEYVSCSMGSRTCEEGGKWSKCVGQQVITLNSWQAGGLEAQAQPGGTASPTTCDPFLFVVNADVTDHSVNTGVQTGGSGVQLKQVTVTGGPIAACPMGTMLTVTPNTSPAKDLQLTVVASPPTPNTVQFNATLPACAGTLQPIWTVDQPSYATISASGKLTLLYPFVGIINVTAYVGTLSTVVPVNVTVSAVDSSAVTNGATVATQFLSTCGVP